MFPDIQRHSLRSYIEKAVRMGKIAGRANGTFDPDVPVTRAEMAVMFTRTPMTWGEVVRFATPSVAYLEKGSHGTGFVISPNGHILTAKHVIGEKEFMSARFKDGSVDVADVVKVHSTYDIGLLKLRTLRPHHLNVDDDNRVYQGEQVISVGHPLNDEWVTTWGFVEREKVADRKHEFDVTIQYGSGNSGGPVLNQCGEVVGVAIRSTGDCTNAVYLKEWIEENAE